MRVLLAGAGGVIGRPLTRALLAEGHEVLGLTRSERSHAALRAAGATPVTADALDADALQRALRGMRADAVIHQLTDLRRPPITHRHMRGTNRLREEGTRNLVRAAEQLGATRFLTQSIVVGYGYGGDGRPHAEGEEFAPAGQGAFEEHLAAMRTNERLVLGSDRFAGTALRYGLFYGVGAGDDDLVAALRKRRMPVLKEAAPLSWIYVDDAVSATVATLTRGVGGEAYNVVDDAPVSWTQLMRDAAAALGAPPPRVVPGWLLAPAAYARRVMQGGMCASNAKARAALSWAPAVPTWREGVGLIAAAHVGTTAGGARVGQAAG